MARRRVAGEARVARDGCRGESHPGQPSPLHSGWPLPFLPGRCRLPQIERAWIAEYGLRTCRKRSFGHVQPAAAGRVPRKQRLRQNPRPTRTISGRFSSGLVGKCLAGIRVCREVPGRHPGWSGSAWPASEIVENRGARIQVCRQWCRRSPSVADGCPGQPSPARQACASRRLHAQRRSVRPIVTISLPTAIFPARANPHRQLRAPQPRAVNPARARGEARRTPPSRHGRRWGGARSPSRAWPRAPAACCRRC